MVSLKDYWSLEPGTGLKRWLISGTSSLELSSSKQLVSGAGFLNQMVVGAVVIPRALGVQCLELASGAKWPLVLVS